MRSLISAVAATQLSSPCVIWVSALGAMALTVTGVPFLCSYGENNVDADELDGWLRDRLATYKRPREYHIVSDLPRTAGGKVRRADLRTRLRG